MRERNRFTGRGSWMVEWEGDHVAFHVFKMNRLARRFK